MSSWSSARRRGLFIVLKTSWFLLKEDVGWQWIVPGLSSLKRGGSCRLWRHSPSSLWPQCGCGCGCGRVASGQGLCWELTGRQARAGWGNSGGLTEKISSMPRTEQPWCHRTKVMRPVLNPWDLRETGEGRLGVPGWPGRRGGQRLTKPSVA